MLDTYSRLGAAAPTRDETISRSQLALILGVLGSTYIFNGMDRQMLPALLSQISQNYHLTLAEGGFLSTSFAFNMALFGALSGWVMKCFGRRATLIGGVFAYSLFTFLTPLASSFTGLALYRTLTGAGEALHMCAIYSCIGAYFGARRGAAMGFIGASFGVGAFVGPVLGTFIFSITGSWRTPFYIYGLAGIAMAVAVRVAVPQQFSEANDTEGIGMIASATTGPVKVLNRNLMIVAVAYAMIGIAFFSFTALYATYLRTQLNYSVADAGTALGMYGIGSLGGLIGGWLSDKLRTRGMLVATLLIALLGYLLFHGPASCIAQCLLSLAFGFLVTGYSIPRCLSLLQRNLPAGDVGLAVSIGLPLFYLPGFVAGYAFGHMVERFGWSISATLMLTMPPIVAFVLLHFYNPTRSREA